MKTKPNDKLFCGVDQNKILTAKPQLNNDNFWLFVSFIKERQLIHNKRVLQGLPKPWTNDSILLNYKFTNVRRENDRQSQMLINSISLNNSLTLEEKIYNSILFRAWNNGDTIKFFGGPWKKEELLGERYQLGLHPAEYLLDASREKVSTDPGRMYYSSAYNQGGSKSAWSYPSLYNRGFKEECIPIRPFHLINYMVEQDTVKRILSARDQEDVYKVLLDLPGVASFLAYQFFVDLTYIPEFPFSENEFVIAGPGCINGLNRIFIDYDGLTPEEAIFWLRRTLNGLPKNMIDFDFLFYNLDKEDRSMNVMSIENCLCEISKYIRTYYQEGRPRVKYNGK